MYLVASGTVADRFIKALLEAAIASGDLSPEGMLAAYAGLGEVDAMGLADNYVYGVPEDRIPSAGNRILMFDATHLPDLLTEVARVESPLTETFELE